MNQPQYAQAAAYVAALTGLDASEAVLDWRCVHDTNKQIPAHSYRDTLPNVWQLLCEYNAKGYGIFANINALDGHGRELSNVQYIRAHVIDLDNPLTANQNYEAATRFQPAPTFAVQTSPNKYHVYWVMQSYSGNEFYTNQQRKLRQLFDGDKSVIDSSRVLRVPGFYHQKTESHHLVTCWALAGYGQPIHSSTIEAALAGVNVIEGFGGRNELGSPELAAPSLEWLLFSLTLVDPNNFDRQEWISFMAAFKQAGWTLADDATLFHHWSVWCERYAQNDQGENLKQWNSIRTTEIGWPSVMRRTTVQAYMAFGHKEPPAPRQQQQAAPQQPNQPQSQVQRFNPQGPVSSLFPEILSEFECAEWFKDCFFIASSGEIFSPAGRFMGASQFNGMYGGKHFIITTTGKTTDEAWKAALRSTVYNIPKVDHVRFLPDRGIFELIEDRIGRIGLNTYIPVKVDMYAGDVSPFLNHVAKILPVESDRRIFFDYLAHMVKYPGYKIQFAPLLQSTEGVGKTVFKEVLSHALGSMYVYSPKASELVASGNTFNGWMRGKLAICVDEIKVDERRELVEVLKPMITDSVIEIQRKGVDQTMEDNVSNWIFFTNFRDAVPIDKNGRRYSVFYSALQSKADKLAAGMDKPYFNFLWSWLREQGGLQMVTHWLMNYPIEKGDIPVTAPETSSYLEALSRSRSPMEVVITDCVTDGVSGFRGGYVSTAAALQRIKASGTVRNPSLYSIQTVLEKMGYVELGRAPKIFSQEDVINRTVLYGLLSNMDVNQYGKAQGYE